ncbi:MAG: hypothetical protein WC775_02475 [Patescibacteria group bacterium]|jgi:hypothetical protein
MYIQLWLIAVLLVLAVLFYKFHTGIEYIENNVRSMKKSLFSCEPFDPSDYQDLYDAFNAMEANYVRLKQRYSADKKKVYEIARDWHKYVESLLKLKNASQHLSVGSSDYTGENFQEDTKEPYIIEAEILKKFESLLDKS